jgi:hypothetical protein
LHGQKEKFHGLVYSQFCCFCRSRHCHSSSCCRPRCSGSRSVGTDLRRCWPWRPSPSSLRTNVRPQRPWCPGSGPLRTNVRCQGSRCPGARPLWTNVRSQGSWCSGPSSVRTDFHRQRPRCPGSRSLRANNGLSKAALSLLDSSHSAFDGTATRPSSCWAGD